MGGMDSSVHVIDAESIEAVNAALAAGRPLLVRGEPGTGKSQLARAAAVALGRALVSHVVDSRTETRDLLWSLDAVARLAQAQLMGALHGADPEAVKQAIDVRRFVQPGPLWWAFQWHSAQKQALCVGSNEPPTPPNWQPGHGVVVLIDEIDKADPAVPNGLLDALGHGRFDHPLGGGQVITMDRAHAPLVVITTNEERSLPDAFLRRCLVLQLALPEEPGALEDALMARARAHFPPSKCADTVLRRAAVLLRADREELRRRDLSPPGLAEYLDLIRAVCEQRTTETDQNALLERIAKFALSKHPPEHAR